MHTREKEAAPATLSLLTELVQGFRRPAVFGTEQGAVLCMNAAAARRIDYKLLDGSVAILSKCIDSDWNRAVSRHTSTMII